MVGIDGLLKINYVHKDMLRYARSYMILHCMLALDNIGFFETSRRKKGMDIEEYAKENNLDADYLRAVCEYLHIVRIFNKQYNMYSLSKKGEQIAKFSKGTFYFVYAYAPLFENMPQLLKKEKKYKKDIFRRAGYVAEATAETEQWIPLPVIKKIIKNYNFKNILDLGCGNGRFLIELCRDSELRGYGVDISEESINLGEKLVKEKMLEKKITLTVGDIVNMKHANIDHDKIDLVTSMYVLHEFLHEDKDKLITLLANLKEFFKGKYLLICELCRQSSEVLRKKPTAIVEHHLFHALSGQDLMSTDEWRKLFREVGYDSVEEKHFDFAGQSYFLLK
jgi:ubiquinone/menaquinone biosynthesis C-methylase UbiE